MSDDIFRVPIIKVGQFGRYRLDARETDRKLLPEEGLTEEYELEGNSEPVYIAKKIQQLLGTDDVLRMQADLRCRIVPSDAPSDEHSHLIMCSNAINLSSAKARLELQVRTWKAKFPFTHFLGLNLSSLACSLKDFSNKILQHTQLSRALFQKPERFHLTLCTLTLLDQAEINMARRVIKDVIQNAIVAYDLTPLNSECLHIQGLEIMNDDPAATDIVYAKVEPNECCQCLVRLVELLTRELSHRNLHVNDRFEGTNTGIKLHATVMNSLFATRTHDETGKSSPEGQSSKRVPFDAEAALRKFGKYSFGRVGIANNIDLCNRFLFEPSGYYKSEERFTIS